MFEECGNCNPSLFLAKTFWCFSFRWIRRVQGKSRLWGELYTAMWTDRVRNDFVVRWLTEGRFYQMAQFITGHNGDVWELSKDDILWEKGVHRVSLMDSSFREGVFTIVGLVWRNFFPLASTSLLMSKSSLPLPIPLLLVPDCRLQESKSALILNRFVSFKNLTSIGRIFALA